MIGKSNLQMLQTKFELGQMSRLLGHGSNVAFFPLWLCAVARNPLFLAPIYPSITQENISCCAVLRWTTGDLSNRQNQSWIFCCWHHLLSPFQGHTFSPDVLRIRITQTDFSCTCWFEKADMDISALTWKFDLIPTIVMDIFWSLLWLWYDRYNCRLVFFFLMPNPGTKIYFILFYSLTIAKK